MSRCHLISLTNKNQSPYGILKHIACHVRKYPTSGTYTHALKCVMYAFTQRLQHIQINAYGVHLFLITCRVRMQPNACRIRMLPNTCRIPMLPNACRIPMLSNTCRVYTCIQCVPYTHAASVEVDMTTCECVSICLTVLSSGLFGTPHGEHCTRQAVTSHCPSLCIV